MKPKILILLTALSCALISPSAGAREHSGVGNGGEAVVRGDVVHLRDLFATAACDWKQRYEIEAALPEYAKIRSTLLAINPRFVGLLENIARNLSFCFTDSPLLTVDTRDFDSALVDALIDDSTSVQVQVAVKIQQEVFVNRPIYNRMSPRDQALFYLHEIFHNAIAPNVSQRNQRLRSLVRWVNGCVDNPKNCRDADLAFQMRQAGIPLSVRLSVFNYECGFAAGVRGIEAARRDCEAKLSEVTNRYEGEGLFKFTPDLVSARIKQIWKWDATEPTTFALVTINTGSGGLSVTKGENVEVNLADLNYNIPYLAWDSSNKYQRYLDKIRSWLLGSGRYLEIGRRICSSRQELAFNDSPRSLDDMVQTIGGYKIFNSATYCVPSPAFLGSETK